MLSSVAGTGLNRKGIIGVRAFASQISPVATSMPSNNIHNTTQSSPVPASPSQTSTPSPAPAIPVAEPTATPGAATKKPRVRRKLRAPLTMTENAIDRVKVLLAKKPDAMGIRLGVRTRGCNGLSYTLNYAYGQEKFEEMVEEGDVRVLIEPKALMHIVGTTMDYKEDALTAEFTFTNPNAKGECGCGESFNT